MDIPHSGLLRTEAFLINVHGSITTTTSCGRIFLDLQGQILNDQTPKKEVLITSPHPRGGELNPCPPPGD